MKIVVCGVSIGKDYNNKPWVKNALENHRMYCNKHGYDYVLRTVPKTDRIPNWEKINLILELIDNNKYDILFWMDTDSVFTNLDIKIESLLDIRNDFYFSGDTNIINSGHFIFRNTEWSKKQLKHIWDIYPVDHLPLNDNAAMAVWLGGGNGNMSHEIQKRIYKSVDKGYQDKNEKKRIESGAATDYICQSLCDKVKLLPKKKINSYLGDWTDGDFILHVVSSDDNKRNSIIFSSNPKEIIKKLIKKS
jgi:hypothetical protein